MRFEHIIIEGPDCSGKSTLFNEIHKKSGYVYNIQDRSCMSMIVYSQMYNRGIESKWYDKIINELKRLDILYIVLLPSEKTILERYNIRGDEIQDEKSILQVRKYYEKLCKYNLENYPNVLLLEGDSLEENLIRSIEFIEELNNIPVNELVKSLVINSGRNELIDIKTSDILNRNSLDYTILNHPDKGEYYQKIEEDFINLIFKEFSGLNDIKMPQKHNSKRLYYTNKGNISLIHCLWRKNKFQVFVTLTKSKVIKDLWCDYEFLKLLSFKIFEELSLPKDIDIILDLHIRSAYISE